MLDDAPNRFAVLRSVAAKIENRTAATVAVPNAAPTERENCTMAAPVPRKRGPAGLHRYLDDAQ